jgi:DnaJ-class molecular chaperone
MMDIDTALHELLLTRPVTEKDIVRAYRRMAIRFHPDKTTDPDEKCWAQQKFLQVQEAYELLKGLPIDTINTPSGHEMSQETSGRAQQQPEQCAPHRTHCEEPH